MATNRGAYDPRQFLHYPDKNPFSDESQKRLDDLVEDFIRTGIAFANGASVHDLTAEEDIGTTKPNSHYLNGLDEAGELESSPEAIEGNDAVEGGVHEHFGGFRGIDKGKGRDEREGPGLQGLWARSNALSSASPPQGNTADDAISLSSGSEFGGVAAEDEELEDEDGFYEEGYHEDGVLDEAVHVYERDGEDSDSGTELEPLNSRAASSEQEIIYIGDSDEDGHKSPTLSDLEAESFQPLSKSADEEAQVDHLENASDSELVTEEQGALPDVWLSSGGQDEEDHSQGKESDEDESRLLEHGENAPMREVGSNSAARHFIAPAPFINPWASSGTDGVSEFSILGFTDSEHQVLRREPEIEPKMNGQDVSQGEGDAPDLLKPPLQVSPEIEIEPGANAPADAATTKAFPPTHLTSVPVIITPLSSPNPVAEPHDIVCPPNHTVHSLGGDETSYTLHSFTSADCPSGDLVPVGTFSPPRQVAPIFSAAEPPTTSSITYPEVPSSGSAELFHFFDAVSPEIPIMETQHSHDANGTHTSISEMESSRIPNTDCTSVTQAGPPEQFLFEDSAASSGAPTELILHGSHYSLVSENPSGQTEQSYSRFDSMMRIDQVNGSTTKQNPSSAASAKLAEDLSVIPPEVQSGVGLGQPVSGDIFKAVGEPSSSVEPGKVDGDYHITPTGIHPATFDDDGHPADTKHDSTSVPVTKTGSPVPSNELHIVNSEELYPGGVAKESSTAAEDRSECRRNIGGKESGTVGCQENDTLETYGPSPDVQEVRSRNGEVIPPTGNSLVSERDAQDHLERSAPSDHIPTISVGSSTPPLSPEATVTNCSSIPDASVATSDLSTVNAATISVVTSSPPPIHISRPSPIPADIHQPRGTYVGFASEEDHQEENAFPDPRLPPEPTHLRIPVGVISRGLTDDKEDRAESIKVEPPTPHVEDESEDDSLNNAGEKPDGEKPTSSTGLEPDTDGARDGLEPSNPTEEQLATHQEATKETFNVDNVPVDSDREGTTSVIGLTYPDSDSDHLKGREGSGSLVDSPLTVFEGDKHTPSHSEHDDPSSSTSEAVHIAVPRQDDESRTSPPPNGSLQSYNNTSVAGPNGNLISHHQKERDLFYDADTSPESMHSNAAVPVVIENTSPSKVKHSPRISTKRKAKGKGKVSMSSDSERESPSPLSTIRVQVKGAASAHKRSRITEANFESSKQRRLTRSAAARNASIGSIGDGASGSAVSDDRSDVSSIASSSSLVSRILRPTSSKPPSYVTVRSRSSSILSQTSPSSPMAPPIRPYVPHKHSHHSQASVIHPPKVRRRTTTPTSQRSQSPSPSPSAPSQPATTHLTRATCTDHKISIPSPDGALLYFLMPRCTLLAPEVEKDDKIVDCGVATGDEVKRAVGDLDAIGLDLEILGVIRQLAGVDMMREHQVGYLPKPGERIRRRGKQRRPHLPPPSVTQDAAPEVDPSGPSGAGSSHLNPLDQELIMSPASSSGLSFSEASKSEDTDGHKSRHPNALRNEPILEDEREDEDEIRPKEDTVIRPSPSLKSSHEKPNKSRRRGLRTEDAAYQPENDDVESSSGVESSGAKKKLKGIKRRRSEGSALGEQTSADVVESGEMHPKKKRRRRGADKLRLQDEPGEDGSGSPKKNRRKTGHLKPES